MSELKFKVGDQVICNGERRDCSGEIVNIKGTIVKINTELDTPYEVQLHQSVLVDYQWWFRESQLELLKEDQVLDEDGVFKSQKSLSYGEIADWSTSTF